MNTTTIDRLIEQLDKDNEQDFALLASALDDMSPLLAGLLAEELLQESEKDMPPEVVLAFRRHAAIAATATPLERNLVRALLATFGMT